MARERVQIVAGPPGGGKTGYVRDQMKRTGGIQVDFTALFAALTGEERDAEGRYPIRQDGDERLLAASRVWLMAVGIAATGLEVPVYITTANKQKIDQLKELADTTDVHTVDPGRATCERRLRQKYDGELPVQCEKALARWYGGE